QLRSPLSNLKWVIEILMSGKICPVAEKQIEYFRILRENSKRMDELVSDLLIVSRIEQGRLPLQEEKTSLKDLVEKIIKETEILAKASNVEIEFIPEERIPDIVFDPSQVKLAVVNLIENAVRYAKAKGGVKLSLRKEKDKLYFEVKDNGVGIPEKDQKYIFQKFFRSENAKKHQTEGSGLGLYIAKSIIEKSGGKMGFYSKENKGSTFWLTLPIK
ncbi:MAG: HAMP domain-containing histidine kinase, partial [Candidatus Nealsonbacteria bacterium]|nr:HAMP domain-containing histidine kinase [Candidatus Nealsonbacteria bacterium]